MTGAGVHARKKGDKGRSINGKQTASERALNAYLSRERPLSVRCEGWTSRRSLLQCSTLPPPCALLPALAANIRQTLPTEIGS